MTATGSPGARATAQRILAHGIPERGTPDAVAAGAEAVFARLFASLSQWVGDAGCKALFDRAIILARPGHPVLSRARPEQSDTHLPQLAANARRFGVDAVRDCATAVISSIITTLSGLIGEDITTSLLEELLASAPDPVNTTASNAARTEASRADNGDGRS